MTTKKIGIVGKGNVGSALAKGLGRKGHEVRAVGKEKGALRETAAWADVILLAVPFALTGGVFLGAGPWFHGPVGFRGYIDRTYDPRFGYHGGFPVRGERPDWGRHRGWERDFHGREYRTEVRHDNGHHYGQYKDHHDQGRGHDHDDHGNGHGHGNDKGDHGHGHGHD